MVKFEDIQPVKNKNISCFPKQKQVATIVFEECMVAHEIGLKSFTWQMTLRLGLSEPRCAPLIQGKKQFTLLKNALINNKIYHHRPPLRYCPGATTANAGPIEFRINRPLERKDVGDLSSGRERGGVVKEGRSCSSWELCFKTYSKISPNVI